MAHERMTVPLIRGTTTLESALEQEEDMLLELDYPDQRFDLYLKIESNREDVSKMVSNHLGLGSSIAISQR